MILFLDSNTCQHSAPSTHTLPPGTATPVPLLHTSLSHGRTQRSQPIIHCLLQVLSAVSANQIAYSVLFLDL